MFSTLLPLYNHLHVLYTVASSQQSPCSLHCCQFITISMFSTLSPFYNHLHVLYTDTSLQVQPSPSSLHWHWSTVMSMLSTQSPVYNHLHVLYTVTSLQPSPHSLHCHQFTTISTFSTQSQVYSHLHVLYNHQSTIISSLQWSPYSLSFTCLQRSTSFMHCHKSTTISVISTQSQVYTWLISMFSTLPPV